MHRVILGVSKGILVDHRDRNGLNNRRSNLRPANHAQNGWNRKLASNNKSGIHGVSFITRYDKWMAAIRVNGRRINLGLFGDKNDAAKAYKDAVLKYRGKDFEQ